MPKVALALTRLNIRNIGLRFKPGIEGQALDLMPPQCAKIVYQMD